jgi:surface protein
MFHNCKNLKSINLCSFDTKNVNDMSDMFSFCINLNNLDLSSFNIKNVKNISYMFYFCYNLKNLDISSFETQNTIDMDFMVDDNCTSSKLLKFKKEKYKSVNKYYKEIFILIEVKKKDINKKIYFLNEDKENKNYDLRRINELYTELYINNEEYKFKKFFIPKKDGKYNITLKFNIFNIRNC